MSSFNVKTFKDNYIFILLSTFVVVLFLIISLFLEKNSNIEESIMNAEGDENYSQLVINEYQSNNNGTIMASDGGLYDWVEIYNGKSHDVNLTNYSLSDTADSIKWVFPEKTIIKSNSYLIVFLGGKNSSGLIANFKLTSSGNEKIILRNSSKKVIDAVDTVSLTNDQVMARDLKGLWQLYSKATPGTANTEEGYQEYLNNILVSDNKELLINEVLPSNQANFKNSYNEYSGYIELINNTNKTINLKNYAISNNENKPFRYNLPDIDLKAHGVFLIFTSGKNKNDNGEYHAPFKLDNNNGVVIVSGNNKIIDKAVYENIQNGIALVRNKDKLSESSSLSAGFANDKDGINSFQKKYMKMPDGLVINEVITNNYSFLPHNGGSYYDLIELYNNSNKTINLSDYCLSKNKGTCVDKLPDIEIKAHSFYTFMASGNNNLSTKEYYHLNFKISDYDTVYLFKDKSISDAIFIPFIDVGESYGRTKNYGYNYFSKVTPNENNSDGTLAITLPPTINTAGGIYNNDSISVTIKGEGNIYYTTDGTNPTTSSIKYDESINIKKTTVIKAIAIGSDKKKSSAVTETYIINEKHTLPVLSLSLDPEDFKNVQSNAWVVGIEKSAYAEYFEEGKTGFDIPCGFRLFGGSTRGHSQKSFSIKFRSRYGDGKLEYKVFDNRDYATFDTLVLRTASQDGNRAIIRDLLGTSLVDGVTNAYVQAYKPIILYVNGNYWGIYYLREKIDAEYVENNFNTANPNTDVIRIDGDVTDGNKSYYNSVINYMKNNDITKDDVYEKVSSMIDIDSFIDFWVAETFVTNNDIVNYRFFRNPDVDGGKLKFVFYDLDWAFYNYSNNYYLYFTSPDGMNPYGDTFYSSFLARTLMKNEDFKNRFVERVSYQLNEVWSDKRIAEFRKNILSVIEPEFDRHFKRWGLSKTNYEDAVNVLSNYLNQRTKYMIKQTKSYFNLNESEMEKYFGDIR